MDWREGFTASPRAGGTAPSLEAERIARADAEASAARLERLQSVTAALSRARTPDEVAEVTLGRGVLALGGARGLLLVPGAGGGMDVLPYGAEPGVVASARLTEPGPVRDAFHSRAPVFLEDRAALVSRYPGHEGLGGEAFVALPLPSQGLPLGVLYVGYDAPRVFPEVERALAVTIASQCAQALDRARLFIAERLARAEAVAAQRRLAFLDDVSAHLAATLDEAEMVAGVVRLAVPALGDWAGVLALREEGLVDVARLGPESLGAPVEARARALAVERLLIAGEPPRPEPIDEFPDHSGPGPAPRSAVVAALVADGEALGLLAVASADPGRRYGAADRVLIGEVARRAALAIAHARLLGDARAAARAREEFLQVASHELRGPLGTLRLGVQLLLRDPHGAAATRPPEARLRMIERQADRLVRLSEALLDVSRITAGRLVLAREEADLAALVREVAGRYAEEAADAGCALTCDAPGPVRCAFDAARVEQVVSNLVSNALKYGHGKPVRVGVSASNGTARVTVADQGIGIDAADQARIFGRFERAVSGRHYSGLGLGLWIVQQIIAAHGGGIRVASAPGQGSTFTVELPLD